MLGASVLKWCRLNGFVRCRWNEQCRFAEEVRRQRAQTRAKINFSNILLHVVHAVNCAQRLYGRPPKPRKLKRPLAVSESYAQLLYRNMHAKRMEFKAALVIWSTMPQKSRGHSVVLLRLILSSRLASRSCSLCALWTILISNSSSSLVVM